MHQRIRSFAVCLALAAVACNLGPAGLREAPSPGEDPNPGGVLPPAGQDQPAETAGSAPAQDWQPVSMNQGLSNLNSYHLRILSDVRGPGPEDVNRTEMTVERSTDLDARHILTRSLTSSAEEPSQEESVSETYQIGTESCSVSDDEAEFEVSTPMEKEIGELFLEAIDFNPVVRDPEFVNQETKNGVLTDHYVFQIDGFGRESGAVPSENSGEYWLAVDGRYLVAYRLLLELRSAAEGDPSAEVIRSEVVFELTQIDQPVILAFPAACEAARIGGG